MTTAKKWIPQNLEEAIKDVPDNKHSVRASYDDMVSEKVPCMIMYP